MDNKKAGKALRKAFKEAFPDTKFSVTTNIRGIKIAWADGPTVKEVQAIAGQYESIQRDEATGDILSGGNNFVLPSRSISPEFRDWAKRVIDSKYDNATEMEQSFYDRLIKQVLNFDSEVSACRYMPYNTILSLDWFYLSEVNRDNVERAIFQVKNFHKVDRIHLAADLAQVLGSEIPDFVEVIAEAEAEASTPDEPEEEQWPPDMIRVSGKHLFLIETLAETMDEANQFISENEGVSGIAVSEKWGHIVASNDEFYSPRYLKKEGESLPGIDQFMVLVWGDDDFTGEPEPRPKPSESSSSVDLLKNDKVAEVLEQRRGVVEEKRDRREESLKNRVKKHQQEYESRYNRAHEMASAIPFGQPILVGHHSEGRDRRYRAKIHDNFDKAFQALETAQHYEERLKSFQRNDSISSDDPDALEKLNDKLAMLQGYQERMKATNAAVRKVLSNAMKSQGVVEKVAYLAKETGYSRDQLIPLVEQDDVERLSYARYQLSNNNAQIKAVKDRIAQIEKQLQKIAEHGDQRVESFPELKLKVIHNYVNNRLQLIFEGKPPAPIRKMVGDRAFNWAKSQNAWQRKLTPNAIGSAKLVIQSLHEYQNEHGEWVPE